MNTIGVIFDLDGVIVDTAKYHYLAWKKIAKELDIEFTETHNELLKGVSRIQSFEILLSIKNIHLSQIEKQTYLEQKNKDYLNYISKMGPEEILPGAKTILDTLDKLNIKYVLGSASKNASLILKQVHLHKRFFGIVDGNSVSKAKPDPEVFLSGSKILQIPNKNCIVFEDAIAGIEAANKANMISVGIGNKKTLHKANYNFNNLTEVPENFFENFFQKK